MYKFLFITFFIASPAMAINMYPTFGGFSKLSRQSFGKVVPSIQIKCSDEKPMISIVHPNLPEIPREAQKSFSKVKSLLKGYENKAIRSMEKTSLKSKNIVLSLIDSESKILCEKFNKETEKYLKYTSLVEAAENSDSFFYKIFTRIRMLFNYAEEPIEKENLLLSTDCNDIKKKTEKQILKRLSDVVKENKDDTFTISYARNGIFFLGTPMSIYSSFGKMSPSEPIKITCKDLFENNGGRIDLVTGWVDGVKNQVEVRIHGKLYALSNSTKTGKITYFFMKNKNGFLLKESSLMEYEEQSKDKSVYNNVKKYARTYFPENTKGKSGDFGNFWDDDNEDTGEKSQDRNSGFFKGIWNIISSFFTLVLSLSPF